MSTVFDEIPLQYLGRVIGGGTPTADESNWGGDIPFVTPPDLNGLQGSVVSQTARFLTDRGLLTGSNQVSQGVLISCRAPVGYVGRVNRKVSFNQGCKALELNDEIQSRFLSYALVTKVRQMEILANGTTFSEISSTNFGAIRVPLPPLDTQRAIAEYLDRETGEIDAMLDKLDGLSRLLEERRKTEVRDAVAPSDGDFTQVKFLAQVSLGKTVQSNKLAEDDRLTNYVRAANIQPNGLVLDDQKMYMTPDELAKYNIVANDVLVVEGGAGFGRSVTAEMDMTGWGFQNHVIRLRPNEGVVGRFLDYTFKNHLWGGLLEILSDGATIPAISSDKARELPVLAVPQHEQERIVEHLDETTARIDAMLAKANELKDFLTERRSALIFAAVTGQIEVQ